MLMTIGQGCDCTAIHFVRAASKLYWLCLDAKSKAEKHCSIFRLYVVNIVQTWANYAQKIHLATYIQTVQ